MILPEVPGYQFRHANIDDGGEIAALMRRCDGPLGTVESTSGLIGSVFLAMASLASAGAVVGLQADVVVAAGWMRASGRDRVVLNQYVDPQHERALNEPLLTSLEASQRASNEVPNAAARFLDPKWLRIERVLGTNVERLQRDQVDLYESHGFEFFYVETEMHRALGSELPRAEGIVGIEIVAWTPGRDADIREAYNEAFRDRGFAGFDEDDWAGATFSAQHGFRPELSFLGLDGGSLAAFCLCEDSDDPGTGWIDTVGVRPAYRHRGIASALMVHAMRAMRTTGLERAALRVNDDNDRARRVYDRLGFASVKRHVVYRKWIAAEDTSGELTTNH